MVTLPGSGRMPLLIRGINDYLRQTYTPRELVIVLDAGAEVDKARIEAHVDALAREDIRVVRASNSLNLGQLRNFSLECARGEFVAVWDDDDIHHPLRLEVQIRALCSSGARASFLSEVLHLFSMTGDLYWTNYKNTLEKCHPATGVFLRASAARYAESGLDSGRGEDTALCLRLMSEGPVHFSDDAAQLYIYVNHGGNTSGDDHHKMLARSLSVSRARLIRREEVVCQALDHATTTLNEVRVQGNNGLAFTWRARELALG
jgi:glycosyltransferase involved in cell wall biosynthesis